MNDHSKLDGCAVTLHLLPWLLSFHATMRAKASSAMTTLQDIPDSCRNEANHEGLCGSKEVSIFNRPLGKRADSTSSFRATP